MQAANHPEATHERNRAQLAEQKAGDAVARANAAAEHATEEAKRANEQAETECRLDATEQESLNDPIKQEQYRQEYLRHRRVCASVRRHRKPSRTPPG